MKSLLTNNSRLTNRSVGCLLGIIAATLVLTTVGCGGGGGGSSDGDFVGAANANINARPNRIDSGDRTQVSIELSDVHENGIAVKVRYPLGLRYVQSSAFLNIDAKEIDVSPTVNRSSEEEEVNYLVFYLSQSQFKRSSQKYSGESGTLIFQLEGRKSVTDGEIEVDPDVDDPAEDNSSEFDITTPEFVPESSASIEVIAE
jgi:hypothetical protein